MADVWQSVTSLPGLEAGEVQVWRIDLADAAESLHRYRNCLSADELDRSDRFRAKQVRSQFVVARACLRTLLGSLLGVPPREVPITLGAYDKPRTAAANGGPIHFNVAHSRETLLIALCRDSEIGIDIEYLDRETDIMQVAGASFTASERRQIEAADHPELRRRAFFQCWTRKEAVVKADGRGLSLSLAAFEVPVLGSAQSTRVEVHQTVADDRAGLPSAWYVSDLTLGAGISAALAVGCPEHRTRTLIFPLAIMLAEDS